MMANLLRDEALVPAVKRQFAGYHQFLAAAAGHPRWPADRRAGARPRAAACGCDGHSLAFTTWQSLAREQGLDDERAADLMCRLVAAA